MTLLSQTKGRKLKTHSAALLGATEWSTWLSKYKQPTVVGHSVVAVVATAASVTVIFRVCVFISERLHTTTHECRPNSLERTMPQIPASSHLQADAFYSTNNSCSKLLTTLSNKPAHYRPEQVPINQSTATTRRNKARTREQRASGQAGRRRRRRAGAGAGGQPGRRAGRRQVGCAASFSF